MVAKSRRYHNHPFKVFSSATKGDPLLPKIFNVVVDAVIQRWVKIVKEENAGP